MTSLKRVARLAVVLGLLLALFSTAGLVSAEPAAQGPLPGPALPQAWADVGCESYLLPGGAGMQAVAVCLPGGTAAGLVTYAHGYVSPVPTADIFSGPTGNPWDDINPVEIDSVSALLPLVLQSGYAFATTTYSKKGYAIQAAEGDLLALMGFVGGMTGPVGVLQTGASEGGIITAMMLEKYALPKGGPIVGGLALCGPLGGMPEQVKYLGDFTHGFDYLFPDVFVYPPRGNGEPFGVTDVPQDAWTQWARYQQRIQKAIRQHPYEVGYLFAATGAPIATSPDTYYPTADDVLHFSIFGTNDLQQTAAFFTGGTQPYATSLRLRLFFPQIEPVSADAAAGFVSAYYDTTGDLTVPLVSMHTLYDAQVPARHELIYLAKEGLSGNFIPLFFDRYGHCTFSDEEVLQAFGLLALQLGIPLPASAPSPQALLEHTLPAEAAQRALDAHEAQAARRLEMERAPAPVGQ